MTTITTTVTEKEEVPIIINLTRRFVSIQAPSIPSVSSDLTIPQAPDTSIVSPISNVDRTIYENRKHQQRLRTRARQRESQLPSLTVEEVVFELYSTAEIDAYSVVNISSGPSEESKKKWPAEGPNSVRDLHLGPRNDSEICDTCFKDLRGCPGHFGKIVIPKIMHPLSIQIIILVLSCVCNVCGSLLLSKEDIIREGIHRLTKKRRLQAINKLIQKLGVHCKKNTNEKCSVNPIYSSLRENKDEYKLAFVYPGRDKSEKFYRTPGDVYKILNSISNEDAELLGFVYGSHPRSLIMERMLVIPYCARPDVTQTQLGKYFPDDLTTMYCEIACCADRYRVSTNEADKEKQLKDLNFKITHFMKNDGRYSQGGVKVYTDLKKRVQGKTAIVRGNIMGKRVNFAGRTVFGPGAFLRVDQIGVPRLMASKLTRPILVTEFNRAESQSEYDDGKVTHITPQSGKFEGSRIPVTEQYKQLYPDYRLQSGDIIERMLKDGDLVLLSRQPILSKHSFVALYVVLIDDRIIRINLSITTPLNADFDGDEGNIHLPQTIEAYAEAEHILAVRHNLITSQTNKPIIALVQDSLSGVYIITKPEDDLDKINNTIRDIGNELATHQVGGEKYTQLSQSLNEKLKEKALLESKVSLDPIIFSYAIDDVVDAPQMQTLKLRLKKYGINPMGGRAVISATLPEDFDYNAKGVMIKEGVLIKGVLSKDTLGTKDGSIIAEMVKQLGGAVTVDFMSNIQFVIRNYLEQRGFSVGIDDCVPMNTDFRKELEREVESANVRIVSLSNFTTNKIQQIQQENKILETLEITKTKADQRVRKGMKSDSTLVIMADSGAKGTSFNLSQISSLLGQQLVSGKRVPTDLPGNRSLPVFEPGDISPKAKGFCVNSFSSGLTSSEFFFHAMGGREGLTDTAINTAETGYLQHRIAKAAEDIHISPDGSVRTSDNAIVQFVYGDDGFSADELGNVKINKESIPFFRNIQQLAHKVNRKYSTAPDPPQVSTVLMSNVPLAPTIEVIQPHLPHP